jgi:2-oxoglutarate dehydrogenase E1 component
MNNQIGFTTVPSKGRSGTYSTDLAKAINAPIFHVNANSMEDVSAAFKTAAKFRQKYKRDVVVDIIGYRKMGHNELDQPSFTNPLMYKEVSKQIPVSTIYQNELLDKKICTQEEIDELKTNINNILEENYTRSKGKEYEAE